jgi:hypothetical protein
MITNEEKIEFLINRLNNLDAIIKSYIDNAEMLKDKYSLEDKLADCNKEKAALLKAMEDLNP